MQAPGKSQNTSLRLISSREVEKILGIAPSTLQRMRKQPDFPREVRLSPCSIRFYRDEIITFIENRKGRQA